MAQPTDIELVLSCVRHNRNTRNIAYDFPSAFRSRKTGLFLYGMDSYNSQTNANQTCLYVKNIYFATKTGNNRVAATAITVSNHTSVYIDSKIHKLLRLLASGHVGGYPAQSPSRCSFYQRNIDNVLLYSLNGAVHADCNDIENCQYVVSKLPAAYLHSPVEFRTATQSEAVIGRALVKIGQ